MLLTASACEEYVLTHTPIEIAQRLHQDVDLVKSSRLPTLLAFYVPTESPEMDPIADKLFCLRKAYHAQQAVKNCCYLGILQTIRTNLSQLGPGKAIGETDENLVGPEKRNIPTTEEFETAAKVLEYLWKVPTMRVTPETPLSDILTAVQTHIALDPKQRASYKLQGSLDVGKGSEKRRESKYQGRGGLIRCYMCGYGITTPHAYYKALCIPCGSFNLQESALSLPENLNLTGRTALVTGARVNLGFHIALRLLRCGAGVIVSSRYPLDAESRYREQPDFESWRNRIAVVGADFRTARDAFALAGSVKKILGDWAIGEGRLDVLVNNAAQTLTDSVEKERNAVDREQALLEGGSVGGLQVGSGYRAMIRVGESENRMFLGLATKEDKDEDTEPKGVEVVKDVAVAQKSSWTQTLEEIPYEDIITAQSINVLVPLILIRQLLPIMYKPCLSSIPTREPQNKEQDTECPSNSFKTASKPVAYIINLSSREGHSESNPSHRQKNGYHVHTNMCKAALNMITETEASVAWRKHRVALNSVDPGFLSAADGSECPIGWEDGAGRALWCVAKGEEGVCIWGRFLKHYGSAEAMVRPV